MTIFRVCCSFTPVLPRSLPQLWAELVEPDLLELVHHGTDGIPDAIVLEVKEDPAQDSISLGQLGEGETHGRLADQVVGGAGGGAGGILLLGHDS